MANDYPFIMLPVSIFQEDLSAADFKVFGALAMHTNKDRVCRVFVRTICEKTGISRKSAFRSLDKLEQLGYIRRQNEINKGFGANYYYIDFNPTPSVKNDTTLGSKMTPPSVKNDTHIELDLKELYLNSKNLKTRKRDFLQKEVEEEKPNVTETDKQILADIQAEFPEVYLWATVLKTNVGLAIKPISALGERNVGDKLREVAGEMAERYGVNIAILPPSSNIINSVEVA